MALIFKKNILDSTSLLLHMDGSNGSTNFIDSSLNNFIITANGSAQISTAEFKFGGSAGYFDINESPSLKINNDLKISMGEGDFTVEAWIFPLSYGTYDNATLIGGYLDNGIGAFQIGFKSNTEFGIAKSFASWDAYSEVLPALNEWTHIAVTRKNNIIKMFYNGVAVVLDNGETQKEVIQNYSGFSNQIGGFQGYIYGYWDGYIDELRIIKGEALYIANFTPSTQPFPNPDPNLYKQHNLIIKKASLKNGLTPQTAGDSAYQIKTNFPNSTDGLYWIKNTNINSGTPFQIYADMTTDGGGWTLIMLNNNYVGWTYENAILRNQSNPPASPNDRLRQYDGSDGSDNYSIIAYADYIKKSSSGFQYMIDAYSRGSWGGIWTANGNYSFIATNNSQTNITLNTKFDNWEYSQGGGIDQRMPWYVNSQAYITTDDDGGGYWWGTLITWETWYPTPWIESQMPNPGIMWYWVR